MSEAEIPRIERGTNLVVPARDGLTRFVFPAIGPTTYDKAVKEIFSKGLELPTGEEIAYLLDEIYNSQMDEFRNSPQLVFIREQIMYLYWMRVPNINVWTPKNVKNPGLYVIHDTKGLGTKCKIDLRRLEDQLSGGFREKGVRFSQDRKVAFSPRGLIRSEYHEKRTLAQDGAFITNYGIDGAEKLDKIAEKFGLNSYSWIVNNESGKPIIKLSALSGPRFKQVELDAYFNVGGVGEQGYIFGKTRSE